MKEVLYEVRCLKSNEDMILALALLSRIFNVYSSGFLHRTTVSDL